MASALKQGSIKVARVQAMAAMIISRAKYKRPRLVSLTKNWGGIAALISFKDLQESNEYHSARHWSLKTTYHGMGVYSGSASSLYFARVDVPIVEEVGEKRKEC